MNNKHTIQVRHKGTKYVIGIIKRVLKSEAIGNFNPFFCTYNNKKYLVKSDNGDLSDPFRRDETYLQTLYIET